MMRRRSFLRSLSASLGALPFAPEFSAGLQDRLGRLAADLEAAEEAATYWRRVQEEFSLNPGLLHLNCATLGATPRLVIDAVSGYLHEIEGNPAGDVYGWGNAQMESVRERAADFIGAELDEVAFTRNTTEAMNAVATGIDFRPGDQVLTTSHEHGGGMTCWQYVRRHRGVEMRYVEMPRTVESGQQLVDRIEAGITPRTKVCSVSHVDTICGVRMPLAEIAELTRPRDILLVCDGAQAPGMLRVDVKSLGVDTYACSGHKWLLAPKGSGLLYVREEAQDRIRPAFLHSGYQAYSASGGTRGVDRILGLGLTMEFHDVLGRDRIEARGRELAARVRSHLGRMDVEVLTPPEAELSASIVTCALPPRVDAGVVRARMREEHRVMVKRAQGTFAFCEEPDLPASDYNAIRFSTHVFNDELQVDRAMEAFRRFVA
jgi:selenocysteine lyase/cysteine desulfurase